MHPPWITLNFFLILFSIIRIISGKADKNEPNNSTTSEPQEIFDRERRLAPYMTYYVTQSLTKSNTGATQSTFIPITSLRENIFHLDTVTKIPLTNLQNVSPQQIEVLPKPVVRLQSPSILTPTIQADHYKTKEGSRISPQIYQMEPGLIRSQIQPQRIQSETQPPQLVNVNPAPSSTDQKFTALQFVKIIPLITKTPLESRLLKLFNSPQPQSIYSRAKTYTLTPDFVNDQIFFKERFPLQSEHFFRENRLYSGHTSKESDHLRLIEPNPSPDTNRYMIAKIAFSTTTPSPYSDIKFNINNARVSNAENNPHQISIEHLTRLNPTPIEYGREPAISTIPNFSDKKYATEIPTQEQTYYEKKVSNDEKENSQDLVQSQGAEQFPRLRVPQEEKISFLASVTPVSVTNDLESSYWKIQDEKHNKKIHGNQPLSNILSLLKETNKLPQNLTPGNIDAGIKTLALILERLQKQKSHQYVHQIPATGPSTVESSTVILKQNHQNPKKIHSFPAKSGTSTPGRPGIDYPIYSSIPQTDFDCSTQRYKGFFGDPDTNCQVWHYCDLNGGQASFLCPNGTIFSQAALTCDWWFNVKCASTSQLYVLNERLYKYILPFSPSFPEDYSGPVVDTYLAAKFKEMEAKSKIKVLKPPTNSTTIKPKNMTESLIEPPTEPRDDYQSSTTEK